MSQIFDWVFSQYQNTPTWLLVLELISVFFNLASVIYSKRENILVFPTGLIGTGIGVYILFEYELLGDMLINAYYFVMSIIGWYAWSRKVDDKHYIPITLTSLIEKKLAIFLFIITLFFVAAVYKLSGKFTVWTDFVDTITTAIFFVGMWLMAKKKLENWVFWIVGNIITVPLYLYKGLIFTSILYLILIFIAFYGYSSWKINLNKSPQTLLK